MSLLRPVPKTTHPALPAAESLLAPEIYRQAFVGLTLPNDVTPAVIGVTSAISGEGRTTVAVGLARTLAADLDIPVSLVEVDIDRPSLAARFDITPIPGLCEVLRGEYRLDEVLRPVTDTLSVATAGDNGPDSARLLRQIPDLDPFHEEGGPQGIIVLDLPPIINHSYAALAAGVADAIILVVRAAVTPHDIVHEAIARIEDHANRAPQGIIFNGPRTVLPRWWPGRNI